MKTLKKVMGVGVVAGGAALSASAQGATDIPTATTTVAGYVTGAVAIGVGLLLWRVGKRVFKGYTAG